MQIIESKEVSVANLPDGKFKNLLINRVKNPKVAIVNVVLVEHWASIRVYGGYPSISAVLPECVTPEMEYNCSVIHDKEGVAKMGNLLPAKEGVQLFPRYEGKIK